MLKDGLDPRITGVLRVLKQHGGVLGGPGRGTQNPLLVNIGHEGSLPGRTSHGLHAETRKALARGDRCCSGIANAVCGVALKPWLDDQPAISTGEGCPADNVVDGPRRYLKTVDRIRRVVWMMEVQG